MDENFTDDYLSLCFQVGGQVALLISKFQTPKGSVKSNFFGSIE